MSLINLGDNEARVINDGTIIAFSGAAIEGSRLRDTVENDGKIVGDVELDSGDDLFDAGTGTVDGRVLGRQGDDTLMMSQAPSGGPILFDGGAEDGGGDTLDLTGFATAVWVDFEYFGVEA